MDELVYFFVRTMQAALTIVQLIFFVGQVNYFRCSNVLREVLQITASNVVQDWLVIFFLVEELRTLNLDTIRSFINVIGFLSNIFFTKFLTILLLFLFQNLALVLLLLLAYLWCPVPEHTLDTRSLFSTAINKLFLGTP